MQGSAGINQRLNCLEMPCDYLVGRTSDQSTMHCWGQRSCRGQPRLTRVQYIAGVKGHAGVIRGQPEGNCLKKCQNKATKCGQCRLDHYSCRCSTFDIRFHQKMLNFCEKVKKSLFWLKQILGQATEIKSELKMLKLLENHVNPRLIKLFFV